MRGQQDSPFADLCKLDYEIDYAGNDDTMPDGKLKCSSTIQDRCTQQELIHTVQGCKSFCSSSKYFTWTSDYKECFCKNSNSVRTHWDGGVSGNTNCRGRSGGHIFLLIEGISFLPPLLIMGNFSYIMP